METTGIDNIFYSDVSAETLHPIFEAMVRERWKSPLIKEFAKIPGIQTEIFYAKNQKMYDLHDEFGYRLDMNGESCFMLLSNHLCGWERNVVVGEYVNEDGIVIDSSNGICLFHKVWMHTLVTPELPTEDLFSLWLYEIVRTSLVR